MWWWITPNGSCGRTNRCRTGWSNPTLHSHVGWMTSGSYPTYTKQFWVLVSTHFGRWIGKCWLALNSRSRSLHHQQHDSVCIADQNGGVSWLFIFIGIWITIWDHVFNYQSNQLWLILCPLVTTSPGPPRIPQNPRELSHWLCSRWCIWIKPCSQPIVDGLRVEFLAPLHTHSSFPVSSKPLPFS